MRVAVLGCGPTGLLAAYAADRFGGADVTIFSKKRRSEMFGAMYLHDMIPGIPLADPVDVTYETYGTTAQYKSKVYGDNFRGMASPELLEPSHKAWDIRAAYNWLWNQYVDRIQEVEFRPEDQSAFGMLTTGADLVINSMPRWLFCDVRAHKFESQDVWGIGDAPERGVFSPVKMARDNLVVLNGQLDVSWYRASKVFGYSSVEYPNRNNRKPPIKGIAKIVKPTSTNCDCWPEIMHVGRYGKWQKGVLSHEAFTDVLKGLMG